MGGRLFYSHCILQRRISFRHLRESSVLNESSCFFVCVNFDIMVWRPRTVTWYLSFNHGAYSARGERLICSVMTKQMNASLHEGFCIYSSKDHSPEQVSTGWSRALSTCFRELETAPAYNLVWGGCGSDGLPLSLVCSMRYGNLRDITFLRSSTTTLPHILCHNPIASLCIASNWIGSGSRGSLGSIIQFRPEYERS